MSQELERVYDEVVEDVWDEWENRAEEFREGQQEVVGGHVKCARACAKIVRRYGEGSMEEFGKKVGKGRSTIYAYSAAYGRLLDVLGSDEAVSERLDSAPLKITQILEATQEEKDEDVLAALDKAEDENTPARKMRKDREERTTPKNVEVVTNCACYECGAVLDFAKLQTWTEGR